jgi:hypothetical protein
MRHPRVAVQPSPMKTSISYENLAEAAVDYLKAVGIQLKLRPL